MAEVCMLPVVESSWEEQEQERNVEQQSAFKLPCPSATTNVSLTDGAEYTYAWRKWQEYAINAQNLDIAGRSNGRA